MATKSLLTDTQRRELVQRLGAKIEKLQEALEHGEYLAQAASRAMRDHGGPEKFLDLNAAVARFREARAHGQQWDKS